MRLSYVTIENYRSITAAYKINLANFTVLIGKNNEGKTNIIRAIKLCMDNIARVSLYPNSKMILFRNRYNWQSDFPILLQNKKKIKNKFTRIRLDFEMSDDEKNLLNSQIKSNINNAISLFFEFSQNNTLRITVPKKGKNGKAISTKYIQICDFIHKNFALQWIPAIRSESDVISTIRDLIETELSSISNPEYLNSLNTIKNIQQEVLNNLAKKTEAPLKKFLPNTRSISLAIDSESVNSNHFDVYRGDVLFEINDGVLTKLENKGDGVKSLATIALLSQVSLKKNRIIIVDEPENHLHPDAVRYIYGVLKKLSNESQVLVSTHNPIFVNVDAINSNIIVEKGKATPAASIRDIRNTLGVICSDNLISADCVLVVEGKTDAMIMNKIIESDQDLNKALMEKRLCIKYTSGTDNLVDTIIVLNSLYCRYLVLLDYDKAGQDAANRIKNKCKVSSDIIRFLNSEGKRYSELEDLYVFEIYEEILKNKYNLDVTINNFKDPNNEWSANLKRVALQTGRQLDEDEIESIKIDVAKKISEFSLKYFTKYGYNLAISIRDWVKAKYLSHN